MPVNQYPSPQDSNPLDPARQQYIDRKALGNSDTRIPTQFKAQTLLRRRPPQPQ